MDSPIRTPPKRVKIFGLAFALGLVVFLVTSVGVIFVLKNTSASLEFCTVAYVNADDAVGEVSCKHGELRDEAGNYVDANQHYAAP